MILEENGTRFRAFSHRGSCSSMITDGLVVDENSVVINGHDGVCGLLAILKLGCCEIDIIGLPCERRVAHIEKWSLSGVDAPTLVVTTFQRKGIEYLHLVSPVGIKTAVPTTLSTSLGLVRRAKLDVNLEIAEGLLACAALHEKTILGLTPTLPQVGPMLLAIEEDDRSLRWLGSQSGTLADDAFEFANLLAGESLHQHHTILDNAFVLVVGESNRTIRRFRAFHHFLLVQVPTITRQTADEPSGGKLTISQSHYLATKLFVAVFPHDSSGVFSLDGVVGINFGGIG